MYDKGKVIGGLAIFLCLITFPAWYVAANGNADYVPNPVLPAGETRCVESAQYMKEYHMQLLQQWRDMVVRQGINEYKNSDGKLYDINLTGTCLKCHSNKTEFCDKCHTYSGISPNCWDCHNIPDEAAKVKAK